MMMAFGLMCSAGGATFFSLLSGQGETRRMHKAFGNAFVLVCGWEVLLTVFLLVLADPLLVLFGVTDTAYPYAIAYYRIVALGCLFQGLSQLFCDFVRVSGKPVLGMCVTGIGAVTNIILDAVFIVGLDWGVVGAATLSDFAILKALAADGLGVSFLYEAAVARELAGGPPGPVRSGGHPAPRGLLFCLPEGQSFCPQLDGLAALKQNKAPRGFPPAGRFSMGRKGMSQFCLAAGKIFLFTKKKTTMEMPPLRTVVPML